MPVILNELVYKLCMMQCGRSDYIYVYSTVAVFVHYFLHIVSSAGFVIFSSAGRANMCNSLGI